MNDAVLNNASQFHEPTLRQRVFLAGSLGTNLPTIPAVYRLS